MILPFFLAHLFTGEISEIPKFWRDFFVQLGDPQANSWLDGTR